MSDLADNDALKAKLREREQLIRELDAKVLECERDIAALSAPTPLILSCPKCDERHIDEGEFEAKPHHTHACQACGFVWRPAVRPTVGVRYLPGFKNP